MLTRLVFVVVPLMIGSAAFAGQECPAGKSCYYVPPLIPPPAIAPDNYGGDLLVGSPQTAATATYSINGGAAQSISVASGGSTRIAFASNMVAAGFNQVLSQGLFLQSATTSLIPDERMTAKYWQSSATIKPSTVALGTRFRAGGFSLNAANGTDGTGWDYVFAYAPTAANVTVAAPPGATLPFWNDSINTASTSFSLAAGQTYIVRTRTGVDIDGALVTSDVPISVAVGGRGWRPGSCGDDGADLLVPTDKFGSTFVVPSWPATLSNRVRVVADTNGTQVQYTTNGTTFTTATINGGQFVEFVPVAGTITLVTSSSPTIVFQNAGLNLCELDVAIIPPTVFANIASQTLTFNVLTGETGVAKAIIPTTKVSGMQLDGAALSGATSATVPGHPEWTLVTISVAAGTHSVSASSDFQLGLVAGDGGTGLYGYPSAYRIAGCGDGAINGNETCDDGNVSDGDGCSSVCQVETGYSCSGAPSVCGCSIDATCSNNVAGTYCATGAGANSCATAGGIGSPIPADHGVCGGASGSIGAPEAACSTGACNPANNTCAAADGGACTDNSQCSSNNCLTISQICAPAGGCSVDGDCASGRYCDGNHLCQPKLSNSSACTANGQCASSVCDGDQFCGYGNGHGACTDLTATTLCRSGSCSASSHLCVETGDGCVVDADCSGAFCGASAPGGVPFRCQARLGNGQPIPNDTIHAGACTAANGTNVCQGGACDSDNSCGFAQGHGPCATDQQCRSGATACANAGANAGTCQVCSSGNSAACTGAHPVCDLSSNGCAACAADYGLAGLACSSAGAPFCKGDGSCGACAQNTDCAGTTHAGPICNLATGTCGDVCATDGDCAVDHFCDTGHACQAKKDSAAGCASAGECTSGICDSDSQCSYAQDHGPCASDGQCRAGTICITDGANANLCEVCSAARASACAGVTPICGVANRCVACAVDHGGSGVACPSAASPLCKGDGSCGVCTQNADCAGTGHAGSICDPATGNCGNLCTVSADCGANQYCDSNRACQPLKAGDIGCAGAGECQGGVCDGDGKCGFALDHGPCATDGQCRAGTVCVGDGVNAGKCEACTVGHASTCAGVTPVCGGANQCVACTADRGVSGAACPSAATPVCRLDGSCGACTRNTDCAGAGHAGPICDAATGACGSLCTVSADCAANQYCDGNRACQALKGAAAGCATGSECGSGICASDGKCGFPTDHGPCTNDIQCRGGGICVGDGANLHKCEACTAAHANACSGSTPVCGVANACVACGVDYGITGVACPSTANPLCKGDGSCGACTKNADCAGAGHAGPICDAQTGGCGNLCAVDSDCGAGQYCGANHACQSRKESGVACAVAVECASGVCDSDSQCGLALDHGPCTSDGQCRAGTLCISDGPNAGKCEACSADHLQNCTNTTPVCNAGNQCVACVVDFGLTGATCPGATSPVCRADGSCGICATNADCGGDAHGGSICNLTTGACGNQCSNDADCGTGRFCDNTTGQPNLGACHFRIADGQALPPNGCTIENAPRLCASGACDPATDLCGAPPAPEAGDGGPSDSGRGGDVIASTDTATTDAAPAIDAANNTCSTATGSESCDAGAESGASGSAMIGGAGGCSCALAANQSGGGDGWLGLLTLIGVAVILRRRKQRT